jgi:hypothetical protein
MPRTLLAIAAMIGISLLGTRPTQAQQAQYEGPWCAIVFIGEGSVKEICHFRDFASCQAEVISGNRGQCGNNPRYVGRVDARGTAIDQVGRPVKRMASRKHHSRDH